MSFLAKNFADFWHLTFEGKQRTYEVHLPSEISLKQERISVSNLGHAF